MCKCFQIGGPFIAEDPDCPAHGTAAQRERQVEDERINGLVSALRYIVAQDPIELVLDPQWPQRIARIALTEAGYSEATKSSLAAPHSAAFTSAPASAVGAVFSGE